MPEVTLRHEIGTDEDTFWRRIVFDEGFNKKLYEGALEFPGWQLVDSKEDDAMISRRVRVEPPLRDVPGSVRKIIGDRLWYVEEGTFEKKSRRYSFRVTPSAMAEKTKVSGELWTETVGDKRIRRVFRISVEVKIFAVGGMVEDRIMADLRASYDDSTTFTNRYLEENGL